MRWLPGRALLIVTVVAATACSAPAEAPRSHTPMANTFGSSEELARAVLSALELRDAGTLRTLPLSEDEYRTHVWPELPVSRPERNVPFDYAWGQMKQRSDGSFQQTFSRYGGRHLVFVSARFTGETTHYASFTVMRESEIIARDADGRDLVLRLYGSALLKDGRFKMFSYVVDD